MAPFLNGDWVIHNYQIIGEQVVLDQADWEVMLHVNNASGDLRIAPRPASSRRSHPQRWRYTFDAARAISPSA